MARRTTVADYQDSREPHPLSSFSAFSAPPSSAASIQSTPAGPTLRTRSAARAENALNSADTTGTPPTGSTVSRKRKATTRRGKPQDEPELPSQPSSPPRKIKRQRTAVATSSSTAPAPPSTAPRSRQRSRNLPAMSQPGPSSHPSDENSRVRASSSNSRRKSGRSGKSTRRDKDALPTGTENHTSQSPQRRPKKRSPKHSPDVPMKDADSQASEADPSKDDDDDQSSQPSESNDDNHTAGLMDDDGGDPFRNALFGHRTPLGLQNTLRALTGMMTSMSSRLREILGQLRMKEDPSIQLIALQELSDLLLVSNEDNLSGQFSPDSFVKELVKLMQPSETGEENPEIMLLACRCLANMMEALRGSVTNVVYGGAVPVLCQKLLDIQFIDLAEQALSTLAKISEDFPASIVREGGLTACLTYLDFFPTSTQRTAVTTAANCCRSLPGDSFPVIRDVMPTLLNVLSSNDQRVVEQACLCVSRIVESFRNKPEKLEELIEPAMLKAILRLLVPGTTNLIGPHIHTQFLRLLGIVAQASPRLSVELLRMDVVDTLYQILTGVSAPREDNNTGIKVDNVVIMQALVHRPREQVFETLGVICELLPGTQNLQGPLSRFDNALTINLQSRFAPIRSSSKLKESAEKRRALLADCKPELKRFAMVLLPTLTDAYSSTVNLGVRQKVLLAQLKIIQEIDADVLREALRTVPYASFLAAILSQQDHPLLVSYALQCAELLFERLPDIYRYQFHREGVIAEIADLAAKQSSTEKVSSDFKQPGGTTLPIHAPEQTDSRATSEDPSASRGGSEDEDNEDEDDDDDDDDDEDHDDDDDNEDDDDDEDQDRDDDDASESESSESFNAPRLVNQSMDDMMQDHVITTARAFVQLYEQAESTDTMADKASKILKDLQALASKIKSTQEAGWSADYTPVFGTLASYFDGDAIDSITSAELLRSGIIDALVESFTSPDVTPRARVSFLKAFMGTMVSQEASQASPFSKLIHKLHDLLSRTEHFEVITVGHNSLEITRSNATYMLGKQVRLRLVADEASDIPRPYKNIMVSIHAIATFKSLDDFLRPRISLSERPRPSRNLDFLSQLANADRLRESPHASQSSGENDPLPPSNRHRGLPKEVLSALRGELDGRDRRHGTHRSSRTQSSNQADEEPSDDRPLECADEKQLSDEDEDEDAGDDQDEELNTIVDDLDEELSDVPGPEPTAVNMEIASTGKVTARKEDGTRVATPSQSQAIGRGSSSTPNTNLPPMGGDSLAMAGRPFSSYAAAVAAVPQDWHIQFGIDGEPITNDTTVYRAIHHSRAHNEDGGRNVWTSEHTVHFKRMPGPPPPEASSLSSASRNADATDEQTGLPMSLSKEHTTGSILQLLRALHEMNAHLDDLRAENDELVSVTAEPVAQFINNKLTAKLNRQLEEPLIVASSCLPNWSEDLAREFPFLFPFETRHLFLQSTAFGYSRSMMRWQNSQPEDSRRDIRRDDRPFLGRLQRQKVRISRSRILDSAMKVMELYGSSASILEVEYFEEVGTGLGPTLEFYSTVSKEFSKKKLKIWRENESADKNEYAFGKHGLFPAPMSEQQAESELGKKQLLLFKSLGKFVARSMLDSRIIDINFNPTFFRVGTPGFVPSLGAVKTVDEDLANSLQLVKRFADAKFEIEEDYHLTFDQKMMALEELEIDGVRVEDLGLDFTLPGYPAIELMKDGSNISVQTSNIDMYLERVIDFTLGEGVERQIEAFRSGFSQVFAYAALRSFTPNELVMLFGRIEEDWSMETLMDSIKADHGFNMDSKSVRNLLQTMSELDSQQRRDFLQFVTGSPKLPIGGFKSLTPMFTVVCRPSEPPYTPDDYLPSVMTCVNYLKLPDYSSLEVLRERLLVATKEGQGAFHLS